MYSIVPYHTVVTSVSGLTILLQIKSCTKIKSPTELIVTIPEAALQSPRGTPSLATRDSSSPSSSPSTRAHRVPNDSRPPLLTRKKGHARRHSPMRRRGHCLPSDAAFCIGCLLVLLGVLDLLHLPHNRHRPFSNYTLSETNPHQPNPDQPRTPHLWTRALRCATTRAGREFVADSLGYVCRRTQKDHTTGCCASGRRVRFSCHTCTPHNGCCESYERCVSCCMSPENEALRRRVQLIRGLHAWGARDVFAFCRAACRTSSHSVVHENAYRHERHHCYGESRPSVDPALHHGIFDFAKPVQEGV